MILHCIRHGVTAGNLEGRANGATDDAITADQRTALGAVAFASSGYDAIYCSPMRRCRQTADALNIAAVIADPRIVERHLGVFEGLTIAECQARYRDEFAAFLAFDADYLIPQGESRGQHLARVTHWLQEIAVMHANVLAVTHGGVIDLLYRMGAGKPLHGGPILYAGENAALSAFEIEWPRVKLIEFSRKLQ